MSMTWEEYLEDTKEAAESYIDSTRELMYDDFAEVMEEMINADEITGMGSGSYTVSRDKAQENVSDIIYDKRFLDKVADMGFPGVPLIDGPEAVDSLCRLAALEELYPELERYYVEEIY